MSGCTYHHTECGRHFSSLVAFDLHRKKGKCVMPKKGLVEKKGECKIRNPYKPEKDVIIYELEATEAYRKMRSEQN